MHDFARLAFVSVALQYYSSPYGHLLIQDVNRPADLVRRATAADLI
jgi:hypothetical protein